MNGCGSFYACAELVRKWAWLRMEAEPLHVEASFFNLPLHDVVFPHIFSRLSVLEIWGLRVVSKQFLAICEEYFRVCPSLHFDQLQEGQQFSIYLNILRRCETLQSFYMRGLLCNRVLPASLAENHQILVLTLAEIPSTFRKLSLENLELHQVHLCMEKLADRCSELKELFLCSIVPFGDEALDKLTMSCITLVKLTLQNLPISGHSLVRLASQCPKLQHLNVAYSHHIKLVHLEQIFRDCPNLKSVDLRYVGTVSDRTVLALGEYCQQLQRLSVEGCAKVTERTLTPLRERGVTVDVAFQAIRRLQPGQQ